MVVGERCAQDRRCRQACGHAGHHVYRGIAGLASDFEYEGGHGEHTWVARADECDARPCRCSADRLPAPVDLGPDRAGNDLLTGADQFGALVDVEVIADHHIGGSHGGDGLRGSMARMAGAEPDDQHLAGRAHAAGNRHGCGGPLLFLHHQFGIGSGGEQRRSLADRWGADFVQDDVARVGHVHRGQLARLK